MIYVHDVLLTSEDEWSQNFNYVSKLSALANEDEEKWGEEFRNAKLSLEQGYPINKLELPNIVFMSKKKADSYELRKEINEFGDFNYHMYKNDKFITEIYTMSDYIAETIFDEKIENIKAGNKVIKTVQI